ncbi:hypothetical protein QUA54_21680 [Microcoleus sp. MOSTC5]|uniref:hypothetical protein n=1 Tax=Microcoleus sp. MOSTC5 TaxID=3055378 RepID=UPI002FD0923C
MYRPGINSGQAHITLRLIIPSPANFIYRSPDLFELLCWRSTTACTGATTICLKLTTAQSPQLRQT